MNLPFRNHRLLRVGLLLVSWLLLGANCEIDPTDPSVAATMTDLNRVWRVSYQQMLADIGTRSFDLEPGAAYTGMRKVLEGMGYRVVLSEGDYYLSVSIPAEQAFTEAEWREIRLRDEPEMKRIASQHMGVKGRFAKLEPEGLLIDGTVTVLPKGAGCAITITFRLRPTRPLPPESILPRREYPPPYAARTGYDKIWRAFEQQVLPLAGMSG